MNKTNALYRGIYAEHRSTLAFFPYKMQLQKRLAIHLKCLTGLKRIMYIKSVSCVGGRNKDCIFILVPCV